MYTLYNIVVYDGLALDFFNHNLVKKFWTWGRNFLTHNFLTSMGTVPEHIGMEM